MLASGETYSQVIEIFNFILFSHIVLFKHKTFVSVTLSFKHVMLGGGFWSIGIFPASPNLSIKIGSASYRASL